MSDTKVLALQSHCERAYEFMLEEATYHGEALIYEGFLTHLITDKVGLSIPYYARIRGLLVDMGCIRQLKRGGGTSPSQWEMITEPTGALFNQFYTTEPSATQVRNTTTERRIKFLERQVSVLTNELEAIKELLGEKYGVK